MSTFVSMLGDLGGGATHEKLNDHLHDVVQAVVDTGGAGEITLKLKFKPNGKGGIAVSEEVKVKLPELQRGVSMFFADDNGNLLRRDPRQRELFSEVINPETGEVIRRTGN